MKPKGQLPRILLYINKNEELSKLKTLCSNLASRGIGKNSSSHYCVNCNVTLQNSDDLTNTFNQIQRETMNSGYEISCICWNLGTEEYVKKV